MLINQVFLDLELSKRVAPLLLLFFWQLIFPLPDLLSLITIGLSVSHLEKYPETVFIVKYVHEHLFDLASPFC